MKCPKCSRDTYSKKWGRCAACGYGDVAAAVGRADRIPAATPVTKSVTEAPEVTASVTPTKEEVTRSITQDRPVLVPVTESVTPDESLQRWDGTKWVLFENPEPGEECPTCGQKVPMTNAQRQAAYRGRKA